MNTNPYKDKGAELRDESYQKAAQESQNAAPTDASSIEIAYTPMNLIMACQITQNDEEVDSDSYDSDSY